jgi:ribosome-binding ATPase YchF (GTP1/OBG family)
MGILNFIFGWGWKIRRLRKRWDRLREKSLKKEEPLRSGLLKKLDAIENNLRTLEEQKMNRILRARISKGVEIDLSEIKALLKSKPEEYKEYKEKLTK